MAPLSGQIKVGYDADLIGLQKNPIDDIGFFRDVKNVTHVWKRREAVQGLRVFVLEARKRWTSHGGVARVNSIYATASISVRLNMYRSGGNTSLVRPPPTSIWAAAKSSATNPHCLHHGNSSEYPIDSHWKRNPQPALLLVCFLVGYSIYSFSSASSIAIKALFPPS